MSSDTKRLIFDTIRESARPLKAKEIAAVLRQKHRLNLDKKDVNHVLYAELSGNRLVVNSSYQWSLPVAKAVAPMPQVAVATRAPAALATPTPPLVRTQTTATTPARDATTKKPTVAPRRDSPVIGTPTKDLAPTQTPKDETSLLIGLGVAAAIAFMVFIGYAMPKPPAAAPPTYSVPYSVNSAEVEHHRPPPSPRGDVSVRGYHRSDGTYVQPHYRTQQNGLPQDNFSTSGNVNPYTGKRGSRR